MKYIRLSSGSTRHHRIPVATITPLDCG